MRRRHVSAEFEAATPLVNKVFAALRAVGVFAKRRGACCPGCLDTDKLAEGQGYVITTPQREDGFKSDGVLNLCYHARQGYDNTAADTALGNLIVAAARHAGLATSWDGDSHKTINVGTATAIAADVARMAEYERRRKEREEAEAAEAAEAEAERRRDAFGKMLEGAMAAVLSGGPAETDQRTAGV